MPCNEMVHLIGNLVLIGISTFGILAVVIIAIISWRIEHDKKWANDKGTKDA